MGNDDALIEKVAAAMWDSRREIGPDPVWADAGGFWQQQLRELAAVAVRTIAARR